MACTLQVAWDDQLTAYNFGARHPMTAVRVELTIELARAFGLFARPEVSVERPAPATEMQLETVHLQQYIAAVRRPGGPEPDPSVLDFGLGTDDDPVFPGDGHRLLARRSVQRVRPVHRSPCLQVRVHRVSDIGA